MEDAQLEDTLVEDTQLEDAQIQELVEWYGAQPSATDAVDIVDSLRKRNLSKEFKAHQNVAIAMLQPRGSGSLVRNSGAFCAYELQSSSIRSCG